MNAYFELLLLASIVVYVVDLSGFTDTWLGWLSRFTASRGYGPVKGLRPFSCSKCMVWWTCLAWLLFHGRFTLPLAAFTALLSFNSITIYEILIFTNEGLLLLLRKLQNKWQ